ncbi:MAG: ABC transporter ATP-binding protein, partial [Alphaproteobacteria bacterium]|nr:ABC transporter ATP-binding protein [Alphaproteobacteria bacterium]
MLEVKNLSVSYGKHRALDDISVQITKGEVVVILGANGAGKSSLLRAIAGLSEGHCDGDISFAGQTLLGQSPDEIVTGGIALVPEGRAIFGDLNVEENLRLGAYNERARVNEQANLDRVLTLFPKLRERRKQISRTMSGGEQQMVAVGRALMSDPTILMLDEPSLGLSPLLSKELFQALGRIRETGLGVLVVEQNAKLSLAIADRGYLIENGRIVGSNDAASLASDPAVQAAYLGGKPGRVGAPAPRPVSAP